MPEATIASFILRFTQEHTPGTQLAAGAWRGVVRHVQTNEEIRFTQIENALAFIAHYVDIKSGDIVEHGRGEE
jgi:hypothetical protein